MKLEFVIILEPGDIYEAKLKIHFACHSSMPWLLILHEMQQSFKSVHWRVKAIDMKKTKDADIVGVVATIDTALYGHIMDDIKTFKRRMKIENDKKIKNEKSNT